MRKLIQLIILLLILSSCVTTRRSHSQSMWVLRDNFQQKHGKPRNPFFDAPCPNVFR